MTASFFDRMSDRQWPLISVIIPVFNGERDLPHLFSCLTGQSYPPGQVEYLLIDNGSTDRTGELLSAGAQQLQANGCSATALQETAIQSSYAARNCGIRAAVGELLAFTDADCRPQPDWLSQMVLPFEDAAVGLVAGEIASLLGDSVLERYAQRHEVLSQRHTLNHPFRPYGQTANLAVRRAVFEQVGLFRPYLTSGGDADLCWRSQAKGWQLTFAQDAVVQHRHRSTWAGLWQQWRRYGQSNRYLHDLHGVALMRQLSPWEYFYRLSRWLLKELPGAVRTVSTHKEDAFIAWDTPIDLVCQRARSQGQRTARLPPEARTIDWLSPRQN